VFQSKDEQALIIPRVKNRVREFLNTATSDTWFNFPEAFGIAVNLGYGRIYGLHKSLGCSPIETNGFEIFIRASSSKRKLTAELVFALRPKPHPHRQFFSRQP
jgi:hypothetical protein